MHSFRSPRVAVLFVCAALLGGCGAAAKPEPPEGYQPRSDGDFVLDPLVKSERERVKGAAADAGAGGDNTAVAG